ncbi:hypothetical protein INT43_008013 [Umbelopsis isabellina]|uniref:Uncharacterized protein n=1 Tax=Mortierella isabellina TaxID=91625 RepID=A0A8H7PNU0_MORIS|nr:hypothetical protein INT43_008013 [Umbelopsis isabellina]
MFSISALRANTVGYGDLWDNDHDCPDHGYFKDDHDKMQAGETIAASPQTHNVTDYYEKVNPDDAGDYGSKQPTDHIAAPNDGHNMKNIGNKRSATGYN